MNCRYELLIVNRNEVDKIKDLTLTELSEYVLALKNKPLTDFAGVFFANAVFNNYNKVNEFGKVHWDDTCKRIQSKGTPLFSNVVTEEWFKDYTPYVIGKEGLLEAIAINKQKVILSLKSLLSAKQQAQLSDSSLCSYLQVMTCEDYTKDDLKTRLYAHDRHIIQKLRDWECFNVINLDEDNKSTIQDSWFYEYFIFNLLYLLKMIDWDKQTLILCKEG